VTQVFVVQGGAAQPAKSEKVAELERVEPAARVSATKRVVIDDPPEDLFGHVIGLARVRGNVGQDALVYTIKLAVGGKLAAHEQSQTLEQVRGKGVGPGLGMPLPHEAERPFQVGISQPSHRPKIRRMANGHKPRGVESW
jgi:hypothetical protein